MGRRANIAIEHRDKFIELGLNITHYRKRIGMTQDEFAEKVGMSRTYLGEIEAPNTVTSFSLEMLFKIADALGVPASKLLEFRD